MDVLELSFPYPLFERYSVLHRNLSKVVHAFLLQMSDRIFNERVDLRKGTRPMFRARGRRSLRGPKRQILDPWIMPRQSKKTL